MPASPDRRSEERAYQDWAAAFERRRREIEWDGVSPEEAGFRVLAEIGHFRLDYQSLLHDRT